MDLVRCPCRARFPARMRFGPQMATMRVQWQGWVGASDRGQNWIVSMSLCPCVHVAVPCVYGIFFSMRARPSPQRLVPSAPTAVIRHDLYMGTFGLQHGRTPPASPPGGGRGARGVEGRRGVGRGAHGERARAGSMEGGGVWLFRPPSSLLHPPASSSSSSSSHRGLTIARTRSTSQSTTISISYRSHDGHASSFSSSSSILQSMAFSFPCEQDVIRMCPNVAGFGLQHRRAPPASPPGGGRGARGIMEGGAEGGREGRERRERGEIPYSNQRSPDSSGLQP